MSSGPPGPLVVVGDTLLDVEIEGRVDRVCPDAPVPVLDQHHERLRPGGAGMAAVLARRASTDRPVVLVTALSDDAPGQQLRRLFQAAGVEVHDLGLAGPTPEKIRLRAAGQSLVRLDRGSGPPPPVGPITAGAAEVLDAAAAVVVADYGRGVSGEPTVRRALEALVLHTPVVWDPHLRGTAPVPGAWLVTPNRAEAEHLAEDLLPAAIRGAEALRRVTAAASVLGDAWGSRGVAVTMGERGALLVAGGGPPLVVPASVAAVGDACGAGDRFAVAAGAALAAGAVHSEAVLAAVEAATRFVAAGGASAVHVDVTDGAGPDGEGPAGAGPAVDDRDPSVVPGSPRSRPRRRPSEAVPAPAHPWAAAREVVARVRAQGGTVVATGGCFDLLHVGHVSLLARARELGDCLVVCLNSDASVRALKGAGRPVVSQADRAQVLAALASVDAVAVFDDATPERVLDDLRPDLFVKGGDYAGASLPEARLLDRWGGQAVIVPYLDGRSTSRLLAQVLGEQR